MKIIAIFSYNYGQYLLEFDNMVRLWANWSTVNTVDEKRVVEPIESRLSRLEGEFEAMELLVLTYMKCTK